MQEPLSQKWAAEESKLLIAGESRKASDGSVFEVRNPANQELLTRVSSGTAEDAKAAVDAAQDAFKLWAETPPPSRAEVLFRVGQLIHENKRHLAESITLEEGKAFKEALGEVEQAYTTAMYYAGEGRRLWSLVTPGETKDKLTFTIRRPVGVAAIITPWNFPSMIPFWGLAPALVCGNTVVFKPASYTPLTARMIVELFVRAGLPKGVLNLVTGSGAVVGDALVRNDKVKIVTFTGESQTGKEIAMMNMNYLRKQVLELGGKNPLIVAADADLDIAIGGALWSSFSNAGQKCTASSRIIVEEPVLEKFTREFTRKAAKLRVGNGLVETTEMGPLVSKSGLHKTRDYVEVGLKEGADLLAGGKDYSKDGTKGDLTKGNFYPPTVFSGTSDMKVAQDEIFGPVTTIIPAKNIQVAIELANDTRYGLVSAIYTKDVRNVMKAAAEIDAGVTFVNQGPVGIEMGASFGGMKASGYGRELGEMGIEDYTEKKVVYLDYSYRGHPVFYPWGSDGPE